MNSSSISKRLFACLALLLAHSAAAPARTTTPQGVGPGVTTAEWREFTSAEGRFKVRFPAEPEYQKMPREWAKGMTTDQHLYAVQHAGVLFGVMYMDLPPGGNKDMNASLEAAIVGETRGVLAAGGRVLSTGKVNRGACEGRSLTAALKDSATGRPSFKRGEVFRSGLRAYIVLFVAPGSGDEPATREMSRAFMESFAVADGCGAALPPTRPLAPKTTSTVEGTADAATGWRLIASAEQGFGVLMPGPANLESVQTRAVPVEMFTHTYMHTAEKALYIAEVRGDYPAGFFSGSDSFGMMLDIALNNGRRSLEPYGVALKHLRDLKLGPHPGREYALVSERVGGAVGRAQVYITPQRIYWFAAVDGDHERREQNLERFFSSVKID